MSRPDSTLNHPSEPSSSSSSDEEDRIISTWLASRDPPCYEWKENILKAAKSIIRGGNLVMLKAMNLSLEQLQWWFEVEGPGTSQLIHYACMHGNLEMIKWMAQQGCLSADTQDSDKEAPSSGARDPKVSFTSPLHSHIPQSSNLGLNGSEERESLAVPPPRSLLWFAASFGHLHILLWILQSYGKLFPLTSSERMELLRESARNGHQNIFLWLLDSSETPILQERETVYELVSCAIFSGSIKLVEILEDRSSSKIWSVLKRKNFRFWSWTLEQLASNGYVEMLDLLIKKGWKMKRTTILDGALDASIKKNCLKSFSWFDAHYLLHIDDPLFQSNILHTAVSFASLELVGFIIGVLNIGNDLRRRFPRLLVYTSKNPYIEVAKFLQIKGCYVGTSEEREQMLLDAAMAGNLEFVKWLFRTRLEPSARLTDTIESSSSQRSSEDVREELSSQQEPRAISEISLDETFQCAVLSHAALHAPLSKSLELIKWLHEECGFPLKEIPLGGQASLLHAAAKRGDLDLLRWLVEQKAFNLDGKHSNGETCLDLATKHHRDELVWWLKRRSGRER